MRGRRNNHARNTVAKLVNTAHEALQQGVAAQQGAHAAHALPGANPGAQTQNIRGGKHLRVGHQTLGVAGARAAQAEESHAHDGDHQVHHGGALARAHDEPAGQRGQRRGHQGSGRRHQHGAGEGARTDSGQLLEGAQGGEQACGLFLLRVLVRGGGGLHEGAAFGLVLALELQQVRGGFGGHGHAGRVERGAPSVSGRAQLGSHEVVAVRGQLTLVGHDQHGGAKLRQAVQGAGDQVGRVGVQVSGGLVHQDGQHGLLAAGAVDGLGAGQGACHGEAARLTGAQGARFQHVHALKAQLRQRAHHQVVIGGAHGELAALQHAGHQGRGALAFGVVGAQGVQCHFGAHGGRSEDRRLRNHQGRAQAGDATGDAHRLLRAGGHQPLTHGTGEHIQQGGFAATGGAHDADDGAAFRTGLRRLSHAARQAQRQVGQHLGAIGVVHVQVAHLDGCGVGRVVLDGFLGQGRIDNLLGATQGGHAVLGLVEGGAHIAQRLVALGSEQQHENGGVQAQGAVDQAHTNQHGNQRHGDGGNQLESQRRHEGTAQGLHGALAVALAQGVHGAGLRAFTAQTDNHGQAAHELQDVVREAVQLGLRLRGFGAGVLADQHHEHGNERQGAEQHEGAHHVQGGDHNPQQDRHHRGGNKRGQGLGVVVVQGVQAARKQHRGRAGTLGSVRATGGEHAAQQATANLRLRSGGGTLRAHRQQVVRARTHREGQDRHDEQAGGDGVAVTEDAAESEQPAAVRLQVCLGGAGELNVGAVHVRRARLLEARVFGGDRGKPRVGCAGNDDRERRAEKHGGQGVHGGDNTERAEGFTGVRAQRRAAVSAVIALSFGHLWCLSVLMFVSMTRCVRSTHVLSLVFCCFYLPLF